MSMKLVFLLALVYVYMNCQTEAIRCYSCSDCANTTRTSWETIQTVNKDDACIKTVISATPNDQQLMYRGASSHCTSFSSRYSSIVCCNTDLCNA